MSPETIDRHFSTELLVNRPEKYDIEDEVEKANRRIFIVEGEPGSGKTYLLLDLYLSYLLSNRLHPFFIGLTKYKAPEFQEQKNIYLNQDKDFSIKDLNTLLEQISAYLEIPFIDTLEPENWSEYMARELGKSEKNKTYIFFIDSIYECEDNVRIQIEKYILIPLIVSGKAIIILSGRGKRPIWTNPDLRNAHIFHLKNVGLAFVQEQLRKLKSIHQSNAEQIYEWSGGYPWLVALLGKSPELSLQSLNQSIDILIHETIGQKSVEISLEEAREALQKLALIERPFRVADVDEYLFLSDEQKRFKAEKLIKVLLQNHLLIWTETEAGTKGYTLTQSLAHPIKKWLQEKQSILTTYQSTWNNSIEKMRGRFSDDILEEYKKMFHVIAGSQ